MSHAFVTTGLLDLWSEPRYNSERANQLLWAEVVRTEERRDRFVRVYQKDGYLGWADHRFLKEIGDEIAERYDPDAKWVVATSQTLVKPTKAESVSPHRVTYGARVIRKSVKSGRAIVVLPDGQQFALSSASLKTILQHRETNHASAIVADARRFLGVPYLWGGRSAFGLDCSGFVQLLYGRYGVTLPRDTKDQIDSGEEIERSDIRKGDLLFFDRHVAIALDPRRIIHASVGGNGVRVNSLSPDLPEYRHDLDRDFKQARRVL